MSVSRLRLGRWPEIEVGGGILTSGIRVALSIFEWFMHMHFLQLFRIDSMSCSLHSVAFSVG